MLYKINIQNLKSIQNAELELGNLNLFTGVNGSGKSSIIQALLLLRQSFLNGGLYRDPPFLWLGNSRDSIVNLGTFSDIYHQNAENSEGITIEILEDKNIISFKSEAFEAGNFNNTIKGRLLIDSLFEVRPILGRDDVFQYLAADRISAQEDYPRFQDNELLGKDGSYTPHFLEKYGNKPLKIKSILHERSDGESFDSLIEQVNLWMREISPNIQIKTKENTATNRIELSYSMFNAEGVQFNARKPYNVGHGITPTLPVLVALLSAKPGDLIIIENPETHIHPKGQSRIGMLIAKVASAGVQLIIETHSDHILNGIRVAAKKKWVSAEDVKINYFSRSVEEITTITPLIIDQNGRINRWPKGFFDEWDNMLDELL